METLSWKHEWEGTGSTAPVMQNTEVMKNWGEMLQVALPGFYPCALKTGHTVGQATGAANLQMIPRADNLIICGIKDACGTFGKRQGISYS